jgi:hypothetical protein
MEIKNKINIQQIKKNIRRTIMYKSQKIIIKNKNKNS